MKIENVSGIPFEDDVSQESVYALRHPLLTPLDFNQEILKQFYGNLLEKENINILEIGCGWRQKCTIF